MFHRITSQTSSPKKFWLLFLFAIMALLISACGTVEQDVTISNNEKWRAETQVTIDKQSLTLVNPADIEQNLTAAQAQADAADVNYKWKKKTNDDGSLTYIIKTSGAGYDRLNDFVFDGGASFQTLDEDGLTQFSFLSVGDFSDYKLDLHVGEVMESNGTVSGKGDVSWHGMGQQMDAVFKPKSGLGGILPLVGGAIVAILLLSGVFFFFRSRSSSPSRPSYTYSSSTPSRFASSGYAETNYCHQCGGKLNPNGKFCPHCGASN